MSAPAAATSHRFKIGCNRGRPRVWLDGARLAAAGFAGGSTYLARVTAGRIVCILLADDDTAQATGPHDAIRRVTGRPEGKPIIDMTGASIAHAFPGAEAVSVTFALGVITITAAA